MPLILTKAGLEARANAEATGVKAKATHMAVGDGNGNVPEFTENAPGLVNEVWRGDLQEIKLLSDNLTVEFTGHIPLNVGGWYVREVAIYADETLLAVGPHPPMWNPPPEDTANKLEAVISAATKIQNARGVIELTIDPTKVLASRELVTQLLADHDADEEAHSALLDLLTQNLGNHSNSKSNPHGVTKAQVGLGNLPNAKSDAVDSDSSTQLATSNAVKIAYDKAVEALTGAGKVSLLSTRTSTGTWTLTGVEPGKPIYLGFSGTLAYINVTSGGLDVRSNDGVFSSIGATNGNNGYALSGTIVPNSPTVTIEVNSLDGTLRVYQ